MVPLLTVRLETDCSALVVSSGSVFQIHSIVVAENAVRHPSSVATTIMPLTYRGRAKYETVEPICASAIRLPVAASTALRVEPLT